MSRFATGMGRLTDRMLAGGSVSVVYDFGDAQLTVDAVPGEQLLRSSDRQGNVKVERTDRDFIIKASALTVGGVQRRPADGHKITLTVGGATETYEAMAHAGEKSCWRWCDPYQQAYRIHTKYRATAPS